MTTAVQEPTTKQKKVPVATVHTHFNIFRNIHEAHEGPVTLAEQIAAAERFMRWHERQVSVGRDLLAKLLKQQHADVAEGAEEA